MKFATKVLSIKRLLVGLVFFLLLAIPTRAQEEAPFDYLRAYQDYVFTVDVYNSAHSEYLLAKAQYEQAGTLVAQTRAREATVEMLAARDDVVITYMTAVRMKVLESEGVSDITKNGLYSRIDAEIGFFRDHKGRISSAGTLEDLEEDSDEAAERFLLTERVAYEALANIPVGTLSIMRSEANSILSAVKAKIAQVGSEGKNMAIAERWAFEVENKITRSLDKEIEAQGIIPKLAEDIRGRNNNKRETFDEVIFRLEESRQFLRDALGFMKEIMREITTI